MVRSVSSVILFDDLRHDEITVIDLRRVSEDVGGTQAVSDLVLALLHGHGRHPRHRFDRAGVDLVELGDPIEDPRQLLLEPAGLLLGNGEAGKPGNTMDSGAIDGHRGNSPGLAFLERSSSTCLLYTSDAADDLLC